MITVQSVMLVLLGFFAAALACLLLAPFYRRRAARLAVEDVKRSMPLTSAQIRADKDRLRAEFAITIHKLESRMEQADFSAARQLVEINRRDAAISALEGEVGRMRTFLDEYENARRVLEQTITERLPKVEHRLSQAKDLLGQRDKEIGELSRASSKYSRALDEATQINAQQRDEIHRLNATLTMHAARNRESLRDPRFDAEVALRAEIEALRAKARDQASLISRLQSTSARSGADGELAASAQGGGVNGTAHVRSEEDFQRLSKDLAEAELALKSVKGGDAGVPHGASKIEQQLRELRETNRDQATEVANLKAALKSYQDNSADDRAIKESKLALKARVSALVAQTEQQSATIQTLRSEVAAANEKLARQAAHFMDELRRLGAGTVPATGPSRRPQYEAPRRTSLSDRINAPRPQKEASGDNTSEATAEAPAHAAPTSGFMRARDGSGATESASSAAMNAVNESSPELENSQPPKGRRPGLLERITGLDKPA